MNEEMPHITVHRIIFRGNPPISEVIQDLARYGVVHRYKADGAKLPRKLGRWWRQLSDERREDIEFWIAYSVPELEE